MSTDTSAPIFSAAAALSGPRLVAITLAPAALAIWTAATPMPLVAPWTMKVSPRASRPRSNTLPKTVNAVSGRLAACTPSSPAGSGRAWRASTTQYWA